MIRYKLVRFRVKYFSRELCALDGVIGHENADFASRQRVCLSVSPFLNTPPLRYQVGRVALSN